MKNAISKRINNVWSAFFLLLPKIYKAAPFLFVVTLCVNILHGFSMGAITFFNQRMFDSVAYFAEGNIEFQTAVLSLIVVGIVNVLNQILNGVGNFLPQVFDEKAQGVLGISLHHKMAKLPPIYFENKSLLDDINKASKGKSDAVFFIMMCFSLLCFYIPYFIFMSLYLFYLKPIFIITIVLIFIPSFFTQAIKTKIIAKLEDKSAPIRREFEYYGRCIVDREYFKETRLLGGFSYFIKLCKDSLHLLNKTQFSALTKTNLYELCMKLVSVAGYLGVLYLLFDALMKSEISIGAFSAVFASIGMLFSIMEEVVCRHIGPIASNLGTIRNYYNFMNLEVRNGTNEKPSVTGSIIFKDVSFFYPGCTISAIKDINLKINNGETVAIVGENGSGKTTLVKLLTGLYEPSSGDVFYDNINTKNISQQSMHKNITAVLQRYQRYQMTLGENIVISEMSKVFTLDELNNACNNAGVTFNQDPFIYEYDTILSREFDGIDLSGGQWQKIAIARGIYRTHEIIALDEPTSAIDPMEETRMYQQFAKISSEKTAIVVTHRIGSARIANRIYVMKEGELVESGTHFELLEADGEYSRLYHCQEKWYK